MIQYNSSVHIMAVQKSPSLRDWCRRNGGLISGIPQKKLGSVRDVVAIALVYFCLHKYNESRKCIDFVLERTTEENLWAKHARFIRAQLAIVDKDWKQAIADLEDLLCMEYPHKIQVANSLAYAHWQQRHISQAIFQLESVLKEEGDNASALNSLGFILTETDKDLPRARSLCERATILKLDYSPYLDSFGWVLYKLGQRAKAIYALRKAMILAPESAEVQHHLHLAARLSK